MKIPRATTLEIPQPQKQSGFQLVSGGRPGFKIVQRLPQNLALLDLGVGIHPRLDLQQPDRGVGRDVGPLPGAQPLQRLERVPVAPGSEVGRVRVRVAVGAKRGPVVHGDAGKGQVAAVAVRELAAAHGAKEYEVVAAVALFVLELLRVRRLAVRLGVAGEVVGAVEAVGPERLKGRVARGAVDGCLLEAGEKGVGSDTDDAVERLGRRRVRGDAEGRASDRRRNGFAVDGGDYAWHDVGKGHARNDGDAHEVVAGLVAVDAGHEGHVRSEIVAAVDCQPVRVDVFAVDRNADGVKRCVKERCAVDCAQASECRLVGGATHLGHHLLAQVLPSPPDGVVLVGEARLVGQGRLLNRFLGHVYARRAGLGDGSVEKALGLGARHEGAYQPGAGRVAKDCDAVRVAAEAGNVLLDPLQARDHVREAVVAVVDPVAEHHPAERADAVVDRDDDNVAARREHGPVSVDVPPRADPEGAAVDIKHNGLESLGYQCGRRPFA